ncbi:MAG: adenylate/guanylate cyclase domain-containing protein [Vulcanimicrobiaceae bacterium]
MTLLLLIAAIAVLAVAYTAWWIYRRYMDERAEHHRVRELFSRYVPQPVVDELLARKDPRLFEAREYHATIVYARIRNFSLLAEALSPDQTLNYLNEFYTILGQAVARHHGMIEGLHGDAVTAVFGVLVEEHFQEERALRAALDVLRLTKAMEQRWAEQGRKPLQIFMGVNSGKIVAGDTGYRARREFAIVGAPAHVAIRLERAAQELNAAIVASETTFDVVRDLFVGLPTSSLPLRGLRRLQNAYIVRGLTKRIAQDDRLTLPTERAFTKTLVYTPAADSSVEPDAYIAPETPAADDDAQREYATAPASAETTRFSTVDDPSPAMPELPPVTGTYEDDYGPPFQLPPP